MDEAGLDNLREELAELEAAEARISAERRRLHDRIDYGHATPATREREREVSDGRQRIHKRINSLRDLLQLPDPRTASETQPTVPEPQLSPLSQWSGISQEVVAIDDAFVEEPEL